MKGRVSKRLREKLKAAASPPTPDSAPPENRSKQAINATRKVARWVVAEDWTLAEFLRECELAFEIAEAERTHV